MNKFVLKISFLFVLLIFLSFQGTTSLEQKNHLQPNQRQLKNEELSRNLNLNPNFGKIPLYFIPNEGQVDEKALFYAKASRYTLWLTKEGLVFDSNRRVKRDDDRSHISRSMKEENAEDFNFERDVSRMMFLNSNKKPEVVPINQTEHGVNYFIGNDKSKWQTNIQTSNAVLYKELYRNIDLKVYGVEKQIEYDFIVKPSGEVSDISFEYKDVDITRIDIEENLVIKTKFGRLKHVKPECYQKISGKIVDVEAEFKEIEKNIYGFKVEEYDKHYELIIDPLVLVYSTYLGGSDNDYCYGIAVDSAGAAYITGQTMSFDFPTQNPVQLKNAGGTDAFITKISSSGTALVYSTYLGGSGGDEARGIAVDSSGAVYVTGGTNSDDFPTQNPIQASHARGNAFIAKLNSSGTALVYSTYLGGSSYDGSRGGIAVDSSGAVYVTGVTQSDDFPTHNPIQGSHAGGWEDAFITKINSSGTSIVYSTYLGGAGYDGGYGIAVDAENAAYVTGYTASRNFPIVNPIQGFLSSGYDLFVSKINPSGSELVYSTYLGDIYADFGSDIVVDSDGAAYITGSTEFGDWSWGDPSNAFAIKIDPSGGALDYEFEWGRGPYYKVKGTGIAADGDGAAYVTGVEYLLWGVWYLSDNDMDSFITKISTDADGIDRIDTVRLGGSGDDSSIDIAVDSERAVYVTGCTDSDDFPIQNPVQGSNAGSRDVFITKLWFSTHSLTIISGANGTTNPPPGTYDYCVGSEAVIEAIPDEGFGFSHWSGDASGTDNPMTIVMDSDKSIKANFIRQYALTLTSGTGGTTDPVPGTYLYNKGTKVIITAIPDTYYRFSHWSGDIGGTANPKTIPMNSDKSVTANFIRIIYPPSSFSGKKFLNRSLSQAEYINFLTWQANSNNENIQNYRIYTVDGQSQSLLVELNANTFECWHRKVEKDKPYTYAIVAVNDEGREGDRVFITVQ
jgi:hypothetical protein